MRNMTSVTDARGKISTTAYNANGLVTSSADSTGRATSFGYDANANQTSTTVTNGAQQYVTSLVYNTAGQPTSRTDATARVTNYTYDAWGRLLQQAFPTSGRTSVTMAYDVNGNLTTATDATGSRSFLYDLWNRRLSLSDPRGNTSATYDASGNILSQSDVSGRTISNVFDAAGQISSVTDGNGTGSLTYNTKGQIATLTYPNNVLATYAYDNGGRATGLTHKKADNTLLIGYAATYDNAGRLSQIVETPSNDVTTYSYDNADRLLSEVRTGTKPYSGAYTYDDAGRRLSALVITNGVTTHNGTYSYDGAGRLQQVVDSATSLTENYVWNADGTLASYPGPGYTRLLEYDEEGRLVRIKRNTGGTITTAYEYGYGYDGGRRWRKDYLQNQWTWYPCGVACSAGELVEQQSDLTGATWTTTLTCLRALHSCVAKGSVLFQTSNSTSHFSIAGTADVLTNSVGATIDTSSYDYFGVPRYNNAGPILQWIRANDEGYHLSPRISSISNRIMPGFSSIVTLQNQVGPLPPDLIGYGYYCGPTRSGPGIAIDCIDRACQKHDNCLATWFEFITPLRRWACDCQLLLAAANCLFNGCKREKNPRECGGASFIIIYVMCVQGTTIIPLTGCCSRTGPSLF